MTTAERDVWIGKLGSAKGLTRQISFCLAVGSIDADRGYIGEMGKETEPQGGKFGAIGVL